MEFPDFERSRRILPAPDPRVRLGVWFRGEGHRWLHQSQLADDRLAAHERQADLAAIRSIRPVST